MYKKLSILLLIFFISSNASAFDFFTSVGKGIDGAVNGIADLFSTEQSATSYTLTIDVTPPDSIIKIMNITPKYSNGIELEPGKYDLLVQKEGYLPHREKITISDSDLLIKVDLNKASAANTHKKAASIKNDGAIIISKQNQKNKPALKKATTTLLPNFDIIGLKLGMSVKETKTAIHRYSANLNIKELSSSIKDVPNSDYISQLSTKQSGDKKQFATERFSVLFYMPPNKNAAAAITRYAKYNKMNRPTIEDTKAALIQKYGDTIKPVKPVDLNLEYIWKFNAEGKPSDDKNCGGSINNVEKANFTPAHSACGLYLRIFIKTDGTHVNSIASRLYNKGELAKQASTTHEYTLNNKNHSHHVKKKPAEAKTHSPIF